MRVTEESLYVTAVFCLRLLWDTIYEDWSKTASDQGLTVTEEQALWAIWLFDSSTVTEVARHLQRDKGTISKCVYSLEENGLIARKAGVDRRSYTLELTEKGENVRRSLCLSRGANSSFGLAFAKLTQVERLAFAQLLLTLLKHLEGEEYMSGVVSGLAQIAAQGVAL